MITLEQAKNLRHGDVLHNPDVTNAKGECKRWRVNGVPLIWKTRPQEVRVPLKHGLYVYMQLREYELEFVYMEEECPCQHT